MMKNIFALLLFFMLAESASAQAVVVGIPWEIDIPCNASSWYINMPNNSPAADLWSMFLPPAMWKVTGNILIVPLPGAGQTQTITEDHIYASAQTVQYWGSTYNPPVASAIEPSPQGGGSTGQHTQRYSNQGEIDPLGTRYFDFRKNTDVAPVIVEGVISWNWTGPGSQPPMAICGHLSAEPTALP